MLKNAIFYNILIDRFSRGKERDKEEWQCQAAQFCGGTINGITEQLDYLKELGVDILLPTPFNKGTEYHGYHTTDLLAVDPRFGSMDDLKNFISEAHKRNMKIVMDWTVNHISYKHPFFVEAQKDKNSPYRKWFYFSKFSDKYKCFLDIPTLPKLNLEYPPAKKYILDATQFWMSQGFDGLRMDHVIGISHNFWLEFRKSIKDRFPDAILIGEAVKREISLEELKTLKIKHGFLIFLLASLGFNPTEILIKQYMVHFDAMLDFSFRNIVVEQFANKKIPDINRIRALLETHYNKYPKDYPLIALLDNPDHNRFILECGHDWEKFKEGISIQMSQNNPVNIYYGSEAGISQDQPRSRVEYSDIDIRRPMPWTNINEGILNFYKQKIQERKNHKRHL